MMSAILRLLLVLTFALGVNSGCIRAVAVMQVQSTPHSVIGSWRGDSVCVGNHPTCKNEDVVYRFEAVAGEPAAVMLFADKIIDGKRNRWEC